MPHTVGRQVRRQRSRSIWHVSTCCEYVGATECANRYISLVCIHTRTVYALVHVPWTCRRIHARVRVCVYVCKHKHVSEMN